MEDSKMKNEKLLSKLYESQKNIKKGGNIMAKKFVKELTVGVTQEMLDALTSLKETDEFDERPMSYIVRKFINESLTNRNTE